MATKTAARQWVWDFRKEIDEKTFGKSFDCFAEGATCRLGVAEWNGREESGESLQSRTSGAKAAFFQGVYSHG